MGKINFFSEGISFSVPNPRKTKSWLTESIAAEGASALEINYIFCSDQYLLSINKGYLKHNTFTDIITFDNSEKESLLEGDIFISVQRIAENAKKYEVPPEQELRRVMIHGVLHLLGYGDKTPKQNAEMRKKEDHYLSLWS